MCDPTQQVPLWPSVQHFINIICAEQNQPPPEAGARLGLASLGEEGALEVLCTIAGQKIKHTFTGFINHLVHLRNKNGSLLKRAFLSPRHIAPVRLMNSSSSLGRMASKRKHNPLLDALGAKLHRDKVRAIEWVEPLMRKNTNDRGKRKVGEISQPEPEEVRDFTLNDFIEDARPNAEHLIPVLNITNKYVDRERANKLEKNSPNLNLIKIVGYMQQASFLLCSNLCLYENMIKEGSQAQRFEFELIKLKDELANVKKESDSKINSLTNALNVAKKGLDQSKKDLEALNAEFGQFKMTKNKEVLDLEAVVNDFPREREDLLAQTENQYAEGVTYGFESSVDLFAQHFPELDLSYFRDLIAQSREKAGEYPSVEEDPNVADPTSGANMAEPPSGAGPVNQSMIPTDPSPSKAATGGATDGDDPIAFDVQNEPPAA